MEFIKNKKQSQSAIEIAFFAYVQGRQLSQVESGQLVEELKFSPNQERKLLSSLSKRKWIARVRRGLYIVPPTPPAGGSWTPGEAESLTVLMEDCGAEYQISGLSAFRRYGWIDQIPNRTFLYNDKLSGERIIGSNQFDLAKVNKVRLGAIEESEMPDGYSIRFSSRARALIDAIQDWKRFNSLPFAFEWVEQEIKSSLQPSDLVEDAVKFGNDGTVRRLGVLLERLDAPQRIVAKLEKRLPSTNSTIPLDPTRPKRGTVIKRWGVVANDV